MPCDISSFQDNGGWSSAANRGKLRRDPTWLVPLSVFILVSTLILILVSSHSRWQLFDPRWARLEPSSSLSNRNYAGMRTPRYGTGTRPRARHLFFHRYKRNSLRAKCTQVTRLGDKTNDFTKKGVRKNTKFVII